MAKVEHELFLAQMTSVEPPKHVVEQMLALLRTVMFRKGQVVYEQGFAADSIFFIVTGEVELGAQGVEPWHFSENSVVGVLDAIVGRPYSRTAVAVSDVQAMVLRADDYYDLLEDNFDFCQLIIGDVSNGLFAQNLTQSNPAKLLHGDPSRVLVEKRDQRLSVVERLLVLRQVAAFLTGSTQSLVGLAELARESRWKSGDVIFREGDASDVFWVIASGSIEIERESPKFRVIRGPGDLIQHYTALW